MDPSNHELIAVEWYASVGWPFRFREAFVKSFDKPQPYEARMRSHLSVGNVVVALFITAGVMLVFRRLEKSMPISVDLVPSTVHQAAELMASSVSAEDRKRFKACDPAEQHFGFGMGIRDGWSLWDDETPLKRDAVKNYGIAHADDIIGLITAWAWGLVSGEEFDPVEHCQRYHKQ